MIVDRLENWSDYPYRELWEKVFAFLSALPPDAPEGEYPIAGEDAFARISDYRTRPPQEAILETHRVYADVQLLLRGEEAMAWYPAEGLAVQTPYDADRDAQFYHPPSATPLRMTIRPGLFALFLPEDAHMPSLVAGEGPEEVRKVVVKIRAERLRPNRTAGSPAR